MKIPESDREFPESAKVKQDGDGTVEVRSERGSLLWRSRAAESAEKHDSDVMAERISQEEKTENAIPHSYGTEIRQMPESLEKAITLHFEMIARQAVAARSEQVREFFDGWLTGSQVMLGVLASALSYNLDFLEEKNDGNATVPSSTNGDDAEPDGVGADGEKDADRGAAHAGAR